MDLIKRSFRFSYKKRITLGTTSLIFSSILITISRLAEDVFIPIGWLIVFVTLLIIPFLFEKKEGAFFGFLLGSITMIVYPLGRTSIIESFCYPISYEFWIYLIIAIFIISSFSLVGAYLGSFRELLMTKDKIVSTLVSLEEKRSNFISIISHELRGPLIGVRGYCSFIKNGYSKLSQEQIMKGFDKIDQSIKRLDNLINQISDIEEVQRGSFQIESEPINFASFINDITFPFKSLLGDQFVTDLYNDTGAIIYGDRSKLCQVIENLFRNAIKHTSSKNRKITITTKVFPDEVFISIADNGAGITKENLKRIFILFNSFETQYGKKGSGIGLYLSREIVEAHQGKLTAFSKGISHGSIFTLTLPKIDSSS